MFGVLEFLLFTALLANAVNPEILSASDVEICKNLCASCGAISTFEEQVCRCRIPDNDAKASECMKHVQKQQNEKLKLGILDDGETTKRDPRCCGSKSKKQMRSTDVDRVIKYFVNGGPSRGMPIVANPQEDCKKNETTSPETSESRAATLPEKRAEPDAMTQAEITTTPSSADQSDEVDENPHAIEPRSFLRYQNRLLTTLPQVLLAIPQALATAALAPSHGAQYSLLSVSQRPNILHRSPYPYLLRTAPSLPYGGLRSEQAIQFQVPADQQEHTDDVMQGQLINSYLGVPNALLAGAQTPFPYESLLRASQYDPLSGSIDPRIGDASKMTDEKLASPEAPKFESVGQKSEETSTTALHEAIAQQNLLLRSLSERLHDYASALEASQSERSRNPMPEEPRPMKQCRCSDEDRKLGTTQYEARQTDRVTRSRNKSARSAETSISEGKSGQPILQEKPSGSTKKAEENSTHKVATNGDDVSKAYRRSAMENEEYRWQFLPQYLNQFPQNSYSSYKKKRDTEQVST